MTDWSSVLRTEPSPWGRLYRCSILEWRPDTTPNAVRGSPSSPSCPRRLSTPRSAASTTSMNDVARVE